MPNVPEPSTCAECRVPLTSANHFPIHDNLCAKCWMTKFGMPKQEGGQPPQDPDALFKWNEWAKTSDEKET